MGNVDYRIVFANDIYAEASNILRTRIVWTLEQNDFGTLTIQFSSDGGNTDQALSLYNYIRELPIPVHMHAIGHVGSAAFPLFLAGEKRSAANTSRFFLHEYDWGFTARQTLHRIQEAIERLKNDIKLTKDIISERAPMIPKCMVDAISGDAPPIIVEPARAKELEIISDVGELPKAGPIKLVFSGTS